MEDAQHISQTVKLHLRERGPCGQAFNPGWEGEEGWLIQKNSKNPKNGYELNIPNMLSN